MLSKHVFKKLLNRAVLKITFYHFFILELNAYMQIYPVDHLQYAICFFFYI